MKKAGLLAVLLLAALGTVTAARAESLSVFHFELSKSAPEEGAEVSSASEVRLWFTQVPQEGTTSIRLLDAAREPIHTSDVVQDAEDARVFSVSLRHALAPGEYTVAWRAMGDDGHVVRGEFSFTVKAS
jgi:methionine-rich copper-binding protein CopC